MAEVLRRTYDSHGRRQAAARNRDQMIAAAKYLFSQHGIDNVTVDAIAARAGVSAASIYAQFKSKSGLLREIMRQAIFSARYHAAAARLDQARSPLEQLRLTATVARTIYENEALELGLLRGASLFSAELRAAEQEFEDARYELQRARLEALEAAGLLAVPLADARRIMWMYTSRDVYRMLVIDGGWSAIRYEQWLADTLGETLITREG